MLFVGGYYDDSGSDLPASDRRDGFPLVSDSHLRLPLHTLCKVALSSAEVNIILNEEEKSRIRGLRLRTPRVGVPRNQYFIVGIVNATRKY